MDGEPPTRAGEMNGAKKSEPARELLIFEFPAFADERSDPIGYNWHFTSREPSVDFVQGAFFERLTDFDLSFELKLEQKIPVNFLLEVRDVLAVIPTGCGKSFF